MIDQLPDKLKNDVIEYCKLNNINDVKSFIVKMIRQSLTIEMYGRNPDFIKDNSPEIVVKEEVKPIVIEPIVVEIPKEEPIVVEETLKNEYKIEIDLNKKPKPIEPKIPTTPTDDDIYGEGKPGWFGGSNLYDLIKRKK